MKKIFLMFAVAAAAMGLTGCSETWDGNPVLETHPTEETVTILNTPVLQDQYLMLTSDNKTGSLHMTCSQPQYGYAAIATYAVQVCLDDQFEADKYIELKTTFTDCAEINPVNHEVAGAIEKLLGIDDESKMPEAGLPYMPVYFRLRVFIAPFETSKEDMTPEEAAAAGTSVYFSNVVNYKNIAADYYAVWKPGELTDLYLRGDMNEWGAPADCQFITGEIDSTWVLKNVTILAGQGFKFSTSNWNDKLNLGGSGPIAIDERVELDNGGGSGNLTIDTDFTGDIIIQLDGDKYYVILQTPQN